MVDFMPSKPSESAKSISLSKVSSAYKDQHLHVDQIDVVGMARCGSKDVCFRHGGLNGCNPELLMYARRARLDHIRQCTGINGTR